MCIEKTCKLSQLFSSMRIFWLHKKVVTNKFVFDRTVIEIVKSQNPGWK